MENCCKYIETCPFLKAKEIAQFSSLVRYMKSNFCQRNFEACGRYRIAEELGPEQVPLLMMPDQTKWAQRILDAH